MTKVEYLARLGMMLDLRQGLRVLREELGGSTTTYDSTLSRLLLPYLRVLNGLIAISNPSNMM